MSKKLIILIIILATVAGGIFCAEDIEDYLENREVEKIFYSSEDYVVTKSSTGIIIENEKDQLKIEIPKDWRVIKGADMFGFASKRYIVLYTPDFCPSPQQGCAIEIEIIRLKEHSSNFLVRSADEIRENIEWEKKEMETRDNSNEYHYYEVIYVNNREALKEIVGKSITIEIPVRGKVYLFRPILLSEKCSKEFEEILNKIEIK